jgi:hypothetical protein
VTEIANGPFAGWTFARDEERGLYYAKRPDGTERWYGEETAMETAVNLCRSALRGDASAEFLVAGWRLLIGDAAMDMAAQTVEYCEAAEIVDGLTLVPAGGPR